MRRREGCHGTCHDWIQLGFDGLIPLSLYEERNKIILEQLRQKGIILAGNSPPSPSLLSPSAFGRSTTSTRYHQEKSTVSETTSWHMQTVRHQSKIRIYYRRFSPHLLEMQTVLPSIRPRYDTILPINILKRPIDSNRCTFSTIHQHKHKPQIFSSSILSWIRRLIFIMAANFTIFDWTSWNQSGVLESTWCAPGFGFTDCPMLILSMD